MRIAEAEQEAIAKRYRRDEAFMIFRSMIKNAYGQLCVCMHTG